jgi:hypothetical protein
LPFRGLFRGETEAQPFRGWNNMSFTVSQPPRAGECHNWKNALNLRDIFCSFGGSLFDFSHDIMGSIIVSKIDKLLQAIRNNPKDVRFDDACKIAELLGFVGKGGKATSHRAFSKTGEPVGLNFQNCQGKIPAYQARQLIAMIDRYEDEL